MSIRPWRLARKALKFTICLSFLLFISAAYGQDTHLEYLQGYDKTLSGKRFGYHSPLPDINTSLLLRGRQDYESLEWMTENTPWDFKNDYAQFIWVFGMDVNSSPAEFLLFINDQHQLNFSNSKTSEMGDRVFKGKNGTELTLRTTLLDKYKDQMGFALLKIPEGTLEKGNPVNIKIKTHNDQNEAWFMVFTSKVEESIRVYQNQVVAKKRGDLFHSVSIDFIHTGEEETATIDVDGKSNEILLRTGFNKKEILLPRAENPTHFDVEIKIGDRSPVIKHIHLQPVKEWEIFLVQHTHTDIGYTRPQQEILPEHLRYIDQALDFCDLTDDYPDAAKFRWTCETSWSIREYLKSRPQAQIDRLLNRIKEGRIEATGMFLNYSEINDEAALAAQTKTLRFLKNKGIDVTTAMQNDVNGIAWCMIDYYNNTDVKYLNMGIHAHRARKPFRKPTSFWWQSPAGNRLLAYRSEHYQHGNSLGVTSGQQDILRNNLSKYLSGLEEKGYPYDKITLQFSGYVTDNSPPSTEVCDIIRDWNEKYEWPKLRSSLARDFLIFLDEEHAEDMDSLEAAWPDWWTDGVGSAANETKEVRKAQANMTAVTALFSMAKLMGLYVPDEILNEIDEVYDNILFYTEHTHGAAESVTDPRSQNTINQWGMKAAYAWEAAKGSNKLEEKALAFLEPAIERSDVPVIAIFNTLNWERSGFVKLFLPNTIIPEGADFTITDINEKETPWHRFEQRMEGAYFGLWVEDVPALGYKTLKVNVGKKSREIQLVNADVFENQYYRISFDLAKGIISKIEDKQLNINLLDPKDTLTLGQVIYEELANRHEMERLTNLTRDTVYRPLKLTRSILQDVRFVRKENGPVYQSVFLNGQLPVCADERGADIEIRLYHYQKKIELHYRMIKLPVTTPEGVYVSFPFDLKEGKPAFEVAGGTVYPGINQLPGTSADWNTIQNFASVKGGESQIIFVSPEIPLVQFGDINTGRYYYRLNPKTNHIYSWVLNNYWVTNFKASQEGELRWKYTITSTADRSNSFATRFGWGERIPLKSRILYPSINENSNPLISRSVIDLNALNLILVNTIPSVDGKGIILHIRETEGDHARINIDKLLEETNAIKAIEVNILEEELYELENELLIEHFETKFIKLLIDK